MTDKKHRGRTDGTAEAGVVRTGPDDGGGRKARGKRVKREKRAKKSDKIADKKR